MPINAAIPMSFQAPELDVNAMMQQRMQGQQNIIAMERQRAADAQAAQQAQAQELAQALAPAVASAFSDPSDAGLNAALSLVPAQYRSAAQAQLDQLRGIPDINQRKNVIRASLAQDAAGQAILAQLEPTANARLNADMAAQRAALDRRKLALEETQAKQPKVAQWITDDAGNVTGLDAQGNVVATQQGIGKKTAPAGGGATQESERLAAYNAGRALNAAQRIAEAVKASPAAGAPSAVEAATSILRDPNIVRSEDRQIVASAQRDLIDALLTLATGAAYNKEQLEGQMQSYIPKWSDKPKARENKRQALLDLIGTAKVKAGRAWTPEMESAFQSLVTEQSSVSPTSETPASAAAPVANGENDAELDALLKKYLPK